MESPLWAARIGAMAVRDSLGRFSRGDQRASYGDPGGKAGFLSWGPQTLRQAGEPVFVPYGGVYARVRLPGHTKGAGVPKQA